MAEAKGDEVEFDVLREHEGDRWYKPGDTRRAREIDVAHLIGKTLRKKGEKAEEPAPAGESSPKAPAKAKP